MRRYQIGVFGSGHDYPELTSIAYLAGRTIAEQGHVLITGGLDGVMKHACRGAKENGGLTIGILPGNNFTEGNEYLDVKILTNMHEGRNYLTGLSSNGCLIIGGSEGTLIEAKVVYDRRGPVIVIEGTGGTADYLLKNGFPSMKSKPRQIYCAKSANKAIDILLKILENERI